MSAPAFILREPGLGRAFSAVGDRYVMLATGEETNGAYCLAEAMVPPGGGPPPHVHSREEETFYVLEGEMTFTVEGRAMVAGPGSFVQIPRGTAHAFRNNSATPVRMLIQCVPAGFDRFLAAFATELPSADSPPLPPAPEEIEKLLRIAPEFGITMHSAADAH